MTMKMYFRPCRKIDVVLRDELLVEPLRGLGGGLVVVHHELDLAPEKPTLGVELVGADLVALFLVRAGLGVGAGQRQGGADLERGLRLDFGYAEEHRHGYGAREFPQRCGHSGPPQMFGMSQVSSEL